MYLINNKINNYFWVLTLALFLLSCNSNNSAKDPETPDEYRFSILKLLYQGNSALLKKAPLVDNDIAAIHYYEYVDSMFNVIIQTADNNNFDKSIARIYNAGANIFFGMAYQRTLIIHAEYPIMNFIEVRRRKIELSDSLLDLYMQNHNPLIMIELKNQWIGSMVEFMKVSQNPIYDQMKMDYTKYLTLYDSVVNNYNTNDAGKILTLESEKALFKQLLYLTVNIIRSHSEEGMVKLVEFHEEGYKYAAIIDNIPVDYEIILSLSQEEYYQHFYYSEIVVYNLLTKIANEI